MASLVRRTACLLLLLLLLALGGAVVEARPGPRSPHRKVAPESMKTWSAHRKMAEKSKVPKDTPQGVNFNVDSFGAAGDGQSDDTAALQKAWAKACTSAQPAVVLVPAGKSYLVKEIRLSGPCKSRVTVRLEGTVLAPEDKSEWSQQGHPRWIKFSDVDNLTVAGKGTLDGNGKASWKNSCRRNPKLPCTFAPAALSFSSCKHLKVQDVKLVDAPQIHLWLEYCQDVLLSHLTITAPGNSPENDGIHISHTNDVRIIKAKIKTGDDCLSIATGTTNLYAANIECGPGHGISVGSLGNGNSKAQVSDITIDGAHLSSTMFGARIKTWQGGNGYAKDIKFLNMIMENVKHPIIIDQNYCTMADPSKPKPCEQQKSAVQLSNILFKNIRGTSSTKDAIKLHCSKAFPCRDVILQDIDLTTKGSGEKNAATSTCENAMLSKSSNVSPAPCGSAATKDDLIPLE